MDNVNIGYCGINCEACSVRQYGQGNAKDIFIACVGNILESDMTCSGCKSGSVYAGCLCCKIRPCAASRNLVHCAECRDYPCRLYKKWSRAVKILPHVGDAQRNLDLTKRDGVEVWGKGQQSHWTCIKCGTPFSWYSISCRKCGEDLTQKTYSLNSLQKILFRIILPKVYKRGKKLKSSDR